MSAFLINTYSAWTYGHTINDNNKFLQFSEGGAEITAELNVGAYTLGQFAVELQRAFNSTIQANVYTCTVNRIDRTITISATGTFELLIASGSFASRSVYSLAGFNGPDLTGASTYTGDSASGLIFTPQFLLQDYIDFNNDQRANNPIINESASGVLEVIRYEDVNFMTCNITLQKNQSLNEPRAKDNIIRFSTTGYDDLFSFIQYAVTKAPLEFIEDIDNNPSVFTNCILESTPGNRTGTGFVLRNLYTRGFNNWWETGRIIFRREIN